MRKERATEIQYLNNKFKRDESDVVVLYGTEGVRVKETFKEFVSDKKFFYFCAHECSERDLRYYLKNQVINYGGQFDTECPDFIQIFEELSAISIKNKCVIIFDRIDECARCSGTFFDELFMFVRETKSDNRYLVLLVSDKVGFVENSLVEKLGRLAYCISGFLKVRPLKFLDLVCNYDTNDISKCMDVYSVLGGLDDYWNYYDINLTVKDNIINLFLKNDSVFRYAGINAILSELREPLCYATILGCIAAGNNKLNDIHHITDFTRAKISVYLKNLMELELVEKVYSFDTGGMDNAKKGLYRISNPLVEFWFKFIYPNEFDLNILSPNEFYDKYILNELKSYVGMSFAKVCTEYLNLLNDRDGLPIKFAKQGEWVGKAGTIHLIGQDDMRNYLTGYVCMDKDIMSYEDYEWYVFCLKEARVHPQYEYFFSLHGFDERMRQMAAKINTIKLIEMKDF